VRIQANTYSNLRKIQDELSQEMGGVNLTLSQVIAIVVIEYGTARVAKQREGAMKLGDRWVGTRDITPERAIEIMRREVGEDEFEAIEAAIQQEMDEDAAAEAAWREIQEEEAGRIAAQEREWAEDEGRDPAELTSIDVLGRR
jgi:hypothetical protein